MSEIHDAGIPACPNCGQADRVAAVPAVYLSGRDLLRVAVPARGDTLAHTEVRQATTALSQALAPVPSAPQGRGCLGGLGVLTLFGSLAAAAFAAIAPSPSEGAIPVGFPDAGTSVFPDLSWLWWVAGVGAVVSLALFGTLAARSRARRAHLAGRAQAEAVWSRGWYCARCGTAHFRPAPDVPQGSLSLGEFRRIVWEAGGYGDLVAKYPTV
ncbi:hypothetical protein [Streptacidiphilus jiangxiensis]|uniref:Uncharacterized protein n=1 Tax=Streptacidiphilus jiangxiensis TaxID=235985 RepID=A0A1H7YL02_STRJI|nr:hypothetical protein [Streptacidiphilus jiangxiensis]SEM45967.1 hypothetical protein SAMN05414137_12918 [Streptacidiphilus jiangxiensis]